MKCELIRSLTYGPSAGKNLDGMTAEIGTIIQSPHITYDLVLNGDAIPVDEECAQAVYRTAFPKDVIAGRLTKVQLEVLRQYVEGLIYHKNPVAAGIHPEDYEAFYSGEMIGYDSETGSPIPGENAEYDGPLELP